MLKVGFFITKFLFNLCPKCMIVGLCLPKQILKFMKPQILHKKTDNSIKYLIQGWEEKTKSRSLEIGEQLVNENKCQSDRFDIM